MCMPDQWHALQTQMRGHVESMLQELFSTLSTKLVWPVCLECSSCCVLFRQGLPHSSHTMLRTCKRRT